MSTIDIVTCVCDDCSHELRMECVNKQCDCCSKHDAQVMVIHTNEG